MRLVHPEADPDEIWIGNIYKVDFPAIGWETKRLGIKPLDMSGERLKGGNMRPVFVKLREIEGAGVPIPEYGPVDHRW